MLGHRVRLAGPAVSSARMPSIQNNRDSWDKDWGHDGSDWSEAWGSTDAMWRHSVWPRIGRFLPSRSVLEIAPGRGRLSERLLPLCEAFLGIDLAEACVRACRERFRNAAHARFEQTDGTSLGAAESESVDFVFSWDSLVHVDANVIRAYLAETERCLRAGGFAFLHHSNLRAFVTDDGELSVENPHWRDPGVDATLVRSLSEQSGLICCVQELVQWGVDYYNDCFTLLRKPEHVDDDRAATVHLEHPSMRAEMQLARDFEQSYWRP